VKPTFLIALTSFLIGPFVAMCQGQVGGFREIAVTDKDVIAATNFVVEAQAKKEKVALAKIVKAEVQVVAGRNFRINMDVRVDGGIRTAQATVWAKLDRTYQLTKWEWKGDVRPEEKSQPKPFPGKISKWNDFARHDFQVDGTNVIMVIPPKPLPGRPWAWRGEFFGAFPNADIELVKGGWHLAYIGVPNLFGFSQGYRPMGEVLRRDGKGIWPAPEAWSHRPQSRSAVLHVLGGCSSQQNAGRLSR